MPATGLWVSFAMSLMVAPFPSTTHARLEHKISSHSLLRVRGVWGQAVLAHPKLVDGTITFDSLRTFDPSKIAGASVPQPLTLADADRIQVRGSAAGSMAWKVGLFGAVAGLVMGVAVANMDLLGPSDTSAQDNLVGGMSGAMIGFGAGALLGAAVGAPLRKWKTIYKKPVEAKAPSPPG